MQSVSCFDAKKTKILLDALQCVQYPNAVTVLLLLKGETNILVHTHCTGRRMISYNAATREYGQWCNWEEVQTEPTFC